MKIGDRLKYFRKKIKQTQTEFSNNTGISVRMISHYESNKSLPTLESLIKISDYCNISLDNLVYGSDKHLSEKLKINDRKLTALFLELDKLDKEKKDKIIWALESLIEK